MTHGKPCVNMLGVWNVINRGVQTSGEHNGKKRMERKNRKEEEKRKERRKKGKEEGNYNQRCVGSRTGRQRTRNCATRGRFSPTPVILRLVCVMS